MTEIPRGSSIPVLIEEFNFSLPIFGGSSKDSNVWVAVQVVCGGGGSAFLRAYDQKVQHVTVPHSARTSNRGVYASWCIPTELFQEEPRVSVVPRLFFRREMYK